MNWLRFALVSAALGCAVLTGCDGDDPSATVDAGAVDDPDLDPMDDALDASSTPDVMAEADAMPQPDAMPAMDAMPDPDAMPQPDAMPAMDAMPDPDAMLPGDHSDGDHDGPPPEPLVPAGAEALSRYYVRVDFADGRPATALDPRAFVIESPDETLAVHRVLPDAGSTSVVIETDAQRPGELYTVGPDGPVFLGSGVDGPALLAAESDGPERIVLTFTEPVNSVPFLAPLATFTGLDGHPLRIAGPPAIDFERLIVPTTAQVDGARYRVRAFASPIGGQGLMIVPLDATRDTAEFTGVGAPDDGTPFRVVSAAALDPTTVRVQFNRSVSEASVQPDRFVITQENVNAEAGALAVLGAEIEDARATLVRLTTAPQNEITYRLTVAGVTDVGGRPIGPREVAAGAVLDPGSVTFAGVRAGEDIDSDGDGLSDATEQRGWLVVISSGGEVIEARQMTSDARAADTDGDGLSDAVERRLGSDPRSRDTDFDQIDDAEEFDVWFSDTNDQDSDADGVSDTAEIRLYGTAALDPDTDGDQLSDADEIFLLNANPRRADLPQPEIEIGGFDLTLDAVTEFTTTEGVSMTQSRALEASLTASRENSAELGVGASSTSMFGASASVGFDDGFSFEAEASYSQENSRTVNFTQGSKVASERSNQAAFEVAGEVDFDETITRRIEGAAMLATVTVRNAGDVAFTIGGMELAALRSTPGDPAELLPVAVLQNDAEVSLGTLGRSAEVGPIIFRTAPDGIFPSQVMALLDDARGLVVELSRFDITYRAQPDSPEVSLAEVTEEVTRRTATLAIDFGDGRFETHQIAVARQYGPDGRPMGITLAEALEDVLDLPTQDIIRATFDHSVVVEARGDDVQIIPAGQFAEAGDVVIAAGPNGVVDTLSVGDVTVGGSGFEARPVTVETPAGPVQVRRLTRVLDVANRPEGARRLWAVVTDAAADPLVDVDVLRLQAGQRYLLTYVSDADGDSVFDREEFANGSSDALFNSDGCPGDDPLTRAVEGGCAEGSVDILSDRQELREGWIARIVGRPERRVFSDPSVGDSDGDGLPDHIERDCELDPHAPDSDGDGLTDFEELRGLPGREDERRNFEGVNNLCAPGQQIFADPRNPDTDGDGVGDGVEARLRRSPLFANPDDGLLAVTVRFTQLSIDEDCDPGIAIGGDDPDRGRGDFFVQFSAGPLGGLRRFLVFNADVAASAGLEESEFRVLIPPQTTVQLDGAFTWRLEENDRIELFGVVEELDTPSAPGNPPQLDGGFTIRPEDDGEASHRVGDIDERIELFFVGQGLCGPNDDLPYRWTVSAEITVE